MEAKAILRPNLRQRSRAILVGLALTFGCGFMCSTAQADWLVNDWQSMAKAVKEYAEQAKRWAATAQQYRNTVEHYRQQLISLKQLDASLFAMQNTFQKVPADYNVAEACPGPATIALVSCASVNFYAPCGDCHDEATCAIRRAFAILRDQSTAVLDSISLAEGAGWEERLPAIE